jgi:predicted transcriptional regulator
MSIAKEEVRKILDQLPDDALFEDIQYHIYVCQKIARGLKDVEEGRVVSQEEAEKRMSQWLGESNGPKQR